MWVLPKFSEGPLFHNVNVQSMSDPGGGRTRKYPEVDPWNLSRTKTFGTVDGTVPWGPCRCTVLNRSQGRRH